MNDARPARKLPLILLAICCILPAIQTFVSIQVQWMTFITYPAMKLVMIAIPVGVWMWSRRSRGEVFARIGLKRTNCVSGLISGAIMGALILGAYYTFLYRLVPPAMVADKLESMKLADYYWVMAVVISVANASFEEYYWRGFLLGEMSDRIRSRAKLIIVLGLLFGLHHIFALMFLPDWWVVAIGAAVTMIAGATWTWMRLRGASLWDVYVSHLIADFAVMWCGWDLLCRAG
jgi:uncharacterized protein